MNVKAKIEDLTVSQATFHLILGSNYLKTWLIFRLYSGLIKVLDIYIFYRLVLERIIGK